LLLLTELSPSWAAANCAATLELPSILRNPKAHHRVHKSPPLVPILSQIDPIHTIPSYLSKIHSVISQKTELFIRSLPKEKEVNPWGLYCRPLVSPPKLDHGFQWNLVYVLCTNIFWMNLVAAHTCPVWPLDLRYTKPRSNLHQFSNKRLVIKTIGNVV
jgi:hypothetical protein